MDVADAIAELGREGRTVIEHVTDHHPCSLCEQQARIGRALAARSACDQRDLSVDSTHRSERT
jgi:hypothetical protein